MEYARREERERILGIIEYFISEVSDDTVGERYAKNILKKCVVTIENQ